MISTPSKLSQYIYDESASMLYHSQLSKQQLHALKQQLHLLPASFHTFRQEMMSNFKEWIGQIHVMLSRQIKDKQCLQLELQKSKQIQHNMRKEVIQLKEMINQAMIGYSQQLQNKNNQIRSLKNLLQKNISPVQPQEIKIEEQPKHEIDLQVIQEESEQATFSSARTLREFKDSARQSYQAEKSICRENSQQTESLISPKPQIPQQYQNYQFLRKQDNSRGEHKRTKSFIDNFRKTIEQSFMQKNSDVSKLHGIEQTYSQVKEIPFKSQQEITAQNYKIYKSSTASMALKEITNQPYSLSNVHYSNLSSNNFKAKEVEASRPKLRITLEDTREISSRSSLNSEARGIEEERTQILPIKTFQTPTNASLFKKNKHQRMMTEPSPQRIRPSQNYFVSSTFQTATHARKTSDRNSSHEQIKTVKNVSKQKIKVTSRLIEQMNQVGRNPTPHSNTNKAAVVYLGGKSFFRKFLLELRQAFRKYAIDTGASSDEVKYQGDKRNKVRWGRGRLFYRNGMIYEGEFRENMRHGRGSLYLNGISIYQGQWLGDHLNGEGYLKSMKYMTKTCPPIFHQSSFCGNLLNNRLHGIGTIFLNQKQKIVTKFNNGVPVGQLTYYNLGEIEFGVWPSQ